MSVYASGSDFDAAVKMILHLRDCAAEGIKKYVTFHLMYHTDHIPLQVDLTLR